jgi:hypothetical protein
MDTDEIMSNAITNLAHEVADRCFNDGEIICRVFLEAIDATGNRTLRQEIEPFLTAYWGCPGIDKKMP